MGRLLRGCWYGVLLALIALTLLQFWFLAHIWYWTSHNPESTAFMRARLEIIRRDEPKARLAHRWVPYNRISSHLKRAVIAAEDDKFVDHAGFDWEAVQKAHEKNQQEGEIVWGASTISQQLAKNLFLPSHRTWWRKAQEAVITAMLEAVLTKRRILEIYLNVVEWGDGVWGADAAARRYFGVPASALSRQQAALLAGALINPRRYNPARPPTRLLRRQQIILARMGTVEAPGATKRAAPPPPDPAAAESLEDDPAASEPGAPGVPVGSEPAAPAPAPAPEPAPAPPAEPPPV